MQSFITRLFCLSLWIPCSTFALDQICLNWFNKAGLKKGPDCALACSATIVDMGTAPCLGQCHELCDSGATEKALFALSDLYPGLTDAEKVLAAAEPAKMLRAYHLTWLTEQLCLKKFKRSRTNDASDACRHFIWAALLVREFGIDFSSRILAAHEENTKEVEAERAMDLANNRLGQIEAARLLKEGAMSDEKILKSFEDNLARKKFAILRARPENWRAK